MVTADIFLLRFNHDHLEVLLIRRKNNPFKGKWALPGGYVEIEELPEPAAKRELLEETGISNIPLRKVDVFGEPGRDPRGRTITIVYLGIIPSGFGGQAKAGDDAEGAQWFALDKLPELAFDHDKIINSVYDNFKSNFLLRFWFILLLDDEFSLSQIKWLFSKIVGMQIAEMVIRNILHQFSFIKMPDANNFRKQISNQELLLMEEEEIRRIWQTILPHHID